MRRSVVALAAILACVSTASARDRGFDFYVLSLSWSPAFCASAPQADRTPQCAPGRNPGFVVHGLWPQYETGYPDSCGSRPLPKAVRESALDVMPDAGLVAHEWRKHGTCSGLAPDAYFATVRNAVAKVTIPSDLKDVTADRTLSAETLEGEFVAANPGMTRDGIAIACRSGAIAEVRICLTSGLDFRACAEVDKQGCGGRSLRLTAAP